MLASLLFGFVLQKQATNETAVVLKGVASLISLTNLPVRSQAKFGHLIPARDAAEKPKSSLEAQSRQGQSR